MGSRRCAAAALASLAVLAGLVAPSTAPAATHSCTSFSFKHNGVPWRAKSIRVRDVSCRSAKRLIKAYAEPRNCQFQKRCKVRRYTCRTLAASGSTFTESCTRGSRLVRWRGSYTSR
jgi:hypothetical protein